MWNPGTFGISRRFAMRLAVVVGLAGTLLVLGACAKSKPTLLSDAELDKIGGGVDLCSMYSINGPCMGSVLEVYDPSLGSSPHTSIVVIPAPQSGTVTVNQSFTTGTPSSYQSVTQTNSITIYQPITPTCLPCLDLLNRTQVPGRW